MCVCFVRYHFPILIYVIMSARVCMQILAERCRIPDRRLARKKAAIDWSWSTEIACHREAERNIVSSYTLTEIVNISWEAADIISQSELMRVFKSSQHNAVQCSALLTDSAHVYWVSQFELAHITGIQVKIPPCSLIASFGTERS